MKRKTYLANAIDIADEKAKYDSEARKLISDRTILAWIVKYTVKELKDFSVERIVAAIEGEPEVSEIPIYPGRKKPDTITEYCMGVNNIFGNFTGTVRYDLQSIVIICLNENSWERKATALHGLLGTLFSARLTPEQKEDILSKEYGIKMEVEIKEGMNQMCNLSDAIEERGIARGGETKVD